MRVPPRPRGIPVGFNLTPMIDVVFNLIVFFLVASHFSSAQPSDPVDLPAATQAGDGDEDPRRLVISVLPDGAWKVGDEQIDLATVEAMIADGRGDGSQPFAVHIRGDRDVPYQFIEPLLTACANSSVTSVRFHVVPR
jgi:biopolymer transport protein ExbD